MVFELTIPQPGIAPTSTKGAIISVLSTDWPLSVKQIHHAIKKRFGGNITYQAVHKLAKQLLLKEVLQKEGDRYKLNLKWVSDVRDFVVKIEETYAGGSQKDSVSYEDNVSTMTFKTVSELNRYFMSLDFTENETIYIECAHMWWPLFHSELAYARMKRIRQAKNKLFLICRGDSVPDSWCADFERKEGSNVKIGVDCAQDCDLYAYGDSVIRIYYPKKLMRLIDDVYNKTANMEDIDLVWMFSNFFEVPTEVYLVVNKTAAASEKAKQKILSHFKENG